ncbi:MAG: hypothetical protein NTV57_04660, partial [Cyanobacteria bacterium]|nr:hypothetical protein [Cyanobacteriota bacterium]
MATATASSTSSPAASSGQGVDDNYTATSQAAEAATADAQATAELDGAGTQGGSSSSGASGTSGTAQVEGAASTADDSRLAEPLRAERRKSNQLEKEIRTLRQQLNRFSEINPEEYARLQQAERQKQVLEQQMELRER